MINLIIGTAFGILVGATFAVAYDPCEKTAYEKFQEDKYKFNDLKDDAAMQFHWSNGQPSLHPR